VEIDKFFELEKAGITVNDNSEAAQWLRAIKVIVKEEPVPEKIMQNETFRHLLDSVKLINFVEELFNCEAKNMTDLKAEHEIGFSEGKAKGKIEGRAEGLSEGERNKAREIALKMLAKNKSLEEIAEFTGLTESEIHAASSFFQK
jgi:flagellar biosynthesis/type III secretory pathway protein FliH